MMLVLLVKQLSILKFPYYKDTNNIYKKKGLYEEYWFNDTKYGSIRRGPKGFA